MSVKRRDDLKLQTHFRSDRFFGHNGNWFFYTREATIEGPYASEKDAREQCKAYIKRVAPEASQPPGELALEPIA